MNVQVAKPEREIRHKNCKLANECALHGGPYISITSKTTKVQRSMLDVAFIARQLRPKRI